MEKTILPPFFSSSCVRPPSSAVVHTGSLSVPRKRHVPCPAAAQVWREWAGMRGDVLASPEAATALPAPSLQSTWVFAVANGWAQKTAKWFQVVSQEKQFVSGMFQPSRAELQPGPYAGIQYSSFIQCHHGGQNLGSTQIQSNQLGGRGISKRGFSHQEGT